MSTYSDATDAFVDAIDTIHDELTAALAAKANLNATLFTSMDQTEKDLIERARAQWMAELRGLKARARAFLEGFLVRIANVIGSKTVSNGAIRDRRRFWYDWRYYQDNTADEKVALREVTWASEPAAAAAGIVSRLKVGPFGAGDVMECGRHNATVSVRVTSKPAPFRVTSTIETSTGPKDDLDYTASPGPNRKIDVTQYNELDTGGAVTNPNLTGNTSTANGAAVTAASNWTLTNTSGTPTPLIDTTASKLYRSRALTGASQPYIFTMSTASTTLTYSQPIPAGVLTDRDRPFLPGMPVRLETGATVTLTIGWGSKTQAFTESDMSAGNWVFLRVDRDSDLYAGVFDQASANWSFAFAMGAGAGTNKVGYAYFDAPPMGMWNGNYWCVNSFRTEPALDAAVTLADTATGAGEIHDTLGFLYDDDDEGAYLMTQGTNTLAAV